VVVELDGTSHFERKKQDKRRDEWMTAKGIEVLRFRNWQVDEDLCGVLEQIEAVCEKRIS
jgi:very-short-patch-repair endonuclease